MPTLEKNVAIAKSGVYEYRREEVIRMLGITKDSIPSEHSDLSYFGVYRPAPVLAASVSKFTKLPAVLEHPGEAITGANFREYTLGWTGDSAFAEYISDSDEVIIRSSLNLIDDEAVRAYRSGIREVSPGYKAEFKWSTGTAPDGKKYQIVMDSIESVNHLAMTRAARGGSDTAILDSRIHNPAIYAIKKFMRMVEDSDLGAFRDNIEYLMTNRAMVSEEDMKNAIEDFMSMTKDLPETNEKAQLIRHLQDLPRLKDLDDESAKQAGAVIANLYEKLDADAMGDVAQSEDSMALFFGKGKKPLTKDAEAPVEAEKKPDEAPAEAAPAPEAPAPAAEAAPPDAPEVPSEGAPVAEEQKPMTIDEVPESPDQMDESHVKYLLGELRALLAANRQQAPAEAPAEGMPAAATDGMTEGDKSKTSYTGDSKLFTSSTATMNAARKADDILASIGPIDKKRGK